MISDVFERLDEIASALPPERWMLVGGLMVHAHSLLSGVSLRGLRMTLIWWSSW